jgi:hypothetical protein
MTIKVEREALLRVLSREPSSPTSSSSSSWPFISTCKDDDEFVIVELPTKPHEFFYDDLIPGSTDDAQREEQQRRQKLVQQDDNDDDVASLCTVSTDSISSYSNDTVSSDNDRRVSFAIDLVTDVWTREKTLLEDIPRLYYSSLETQTVRGWLMGKSAWFSSRVFFLAILFFHVERSTYSTRYSVLGEVIIRTSFFPSGIHIIPVHLTFSSSHLYPIVDYDWCYFYN